MASCLIGNGLRVLNRLRLWDRTVQTTAVLLLGACVLSELDYIEESLRPLAVEIATLHTDPANARRHPERNLDAIKRSLARFGQQRPILVDSRGMVLAGNGTLEAARALGWNSIAVVRTDLAGVEAIAYGIADNRTAELAEWDQHALTALLRGLREDESFDQLATGFTDDEIADLIAADGVRELVEDTPPAPPAAATTHVGDLWELGRHRLLCGDSSSPVDLDRLLNGAMIHLVNTDPPYNVNVQPKAIGKRDQLRAKDRPILNDHLSDTEFDRLLDTWFGNIARVLVPGRAFYIWGGYGNCSNYPRAMTSAKLYFSQAIIWVKDHPVIGRKDFMGDHEWCYYGWAIQQDFKPQHKKCLYGWREGAAHRFFGPANVPDVWRVKKVNPQSMVHLTEKPVELARRAIELSSRQGENVLDLFGGSGSTMSAAEQLGRNAFLMELDPLYCDVILQRWLNLTGRQPTRASDGVTFEQAARVKEPAA